MVQMIEEDAWKYLWKLAWSEALLEKFKDRADWETVSGNRDIAQTVYSRIVSTGASSITTSPRACLVEFKDSPIETIRKMADNIDWKILLLTVGT